MQPAITVPSTEINQMKKLAITRSFLAATLFAALLFATPEASRAGVFVSITIAPPALPVYVQPPCPADGYLWTPGYWAYGPAGYFWVRGVWVRPPRSACYGRLGIGASQVGFTRGMWASGDRTSGSMAV